MLKSAQSHVKVFPSLVSVVQQSNNWIREAGWASSILRACCRADYHTHVVGNRTHGALTRTPFCSRTYSPDEMLLTTVRRPPRWDCKLGGDQGNGAEGATNLICHSSKWKGVMCRRQVIKRQGRQVMCLSL